MMPVGRSGRRRGPDVLAVDLLDHVPAVDRRDPERDVAPVALDDERESVARRAC